MNRGYSGTLFVEDNLWSLLAATWTAQLLIGTHFSRGGVYSKSFGWA